jgi:hypothetical protein
LETLKRYEKENDNKNCAKKSKPMFKSFASSHKAHFVGPQISKHELMLKGKKDKEFIYLFIY